MLRLRPYKKCDAKYIASWIKDEVTFRKWCADRYDKYPISAEDINDHYAAMDDSDSFFPMTAFDESGVVGHLIMRFTDDDKKELRFGFVIVDDTKRGKGYGKEMLQLSIEYAFQILKVQKITLGVFENNEPAYRCYKAVGFKDVLLEECHYYHVLGEDWKCLELEMESIDYGRAQMDKKCMNIKIMEQRVKASEYIEFLKRTDLGSQYPKERFEERIEKLVNNVSISLVAKNEEGTIVGVLFGLTDFAYWLYVTDLGVDRMYEGQGIGRKLMKTAHDIAGGEKDIAVYLIANDQAIPFYEKLGMEKADDVMQYNHIEWTGFTV